MLTKVIAHGADREALDRLNQLARICGAGSADQCRVPSLSARRRAGQVGDLDTAVLDEFIGRFHSGDVLASAASARPLAWRDTCGPRRWRGPYGTVRAPPCAPAAQRDCFLVKCLSGVKFRLAMVRSIKVSAEAHLENR